MQGIPKTFVRLSIESKHLFLNVSTNKMESYENEQQQQQMWLWQEKGS
jgi:hypothetical protein